MSETVSSIEASDDEKALIAALCPWPISNEKAWVIAREHLAPHKTAAAMYKRCAKAAFRALHAINNRLGDSIHNNEELRLWLEYAFKEEQEVLGCGNRSEPESQPPSG